MQQVGKFFFLSNPANPKRVGGYDTPGSTRGVAVSGKYAFLADYEAGLQILDISNPAAPELVGRYDTWGTVLDVAISGNRLCLADGWAGFDVLDISQPANPELIGGYGLSKGVAVALAGDLVYLASGPKGLTVVGFPEHPIPVPTRIGPGPLSEPVLRIERLSSISPGRYHLVVAGPPGKTGQLQRSTDLTTWTNWRSRTFQDTEPVLVPMLEATQPSALFHRMVIP